MFAEDLAQNFYANRALTYECPISLRMGFRPSTGARQQKCLCRNWLRDGVRGPYTAQRFEHCPKRIENRRSCAGVDTMAGF